MKLHLDPRTKLFLILLCVLSAMFAPNLYFQFALVTLIGLLAAFSGKWQYALRGMIAYAQLFRNVQVRHRGEKFPHLGGGDHKSRQHPAGIDLMYQTEKRYGL